MTEYSDLGHMSPVSYDRMRQAEYYIPLHCVLKNYDPNKIRVVFDDSMLSSNNTSLNDTLYTGPKLQCDIVNILTRFRRHTFVFTTDVVKMYRAIFIRHEDRNLQHVLWRSSPDKPLREYRLNTITYGLSYSPYLAIRCSRRAC